MRLILMSTLCLLCFGTLSQSSLIGEKVLYFDFHKNGVIAECISQNGPTVTLKDGPNRTIKTSSSYYFVKDITIVEDDFKFFFRKANSISAHVLQSYNFNNIGSAGVALAFNSRITEKFMAGVGAHYESTSFNLQLENEVNLNSTWEVFGLSAEARYYLPELISNPLFYTKMNMGFGIPTDRPLLTYKLKPNFKFELLGGFELLSRGNSRFILETGIGFRTFGIKPTSSESTINSYSKNSLNYLLNLGMTTYIFTKRYKDVPYDFNEFLERRRAQS